MWHGVTAVDVPAPDRFDWFVETISTSLMPSAFSAPDPARFHAEGAFLDLGTAQLSRFAFSPLHSRRTPALIRRGDPEQYQLGLVTRGSAWYAQSGGEAQLRAGDMVLWDTSRPYESRSGLDGRGVEALVLQIPKADMPLVGRQVEPVLARTVDGGTGMGAVLSQFLLAVAGNAPGCRPEDLDRLGDMAVELAVSCLLQQLGADVEPPAATRAHVLLRRIDAFIDQNLADPDLTPRAVAEHHHISLRHLYTLFQGPAPDPRGEGVAASIRRRRLERCRADLARPQLRHHPVHVIAARWGFPNAPAFSRAFRAAYGTTPQAYRAAAAQAGPSGHR